MKATTATKILAGPQALDAIGLRVDVRAVDDSLARRLRTTRADLLETTFTREER